MLASQPHPSCSATNFLVSDPAFVSQYQGQPFYGDFGGISLMDAQESAEPDEGYCYNDYSTREMSPGAVAHDWLCRNGYEAQAESVLVSFSPPSYSCQILRL